MAPYTSLIRDIPDFPKKGILFKDITPLLADGPTLRAAIHDMARPFKEHPVDIVIGIESRGFIFGPGVAEHLGCGFAPARKPGRLPYQTVSISYELEYGSDTLELHADVFHKGTRALIVDDLLATGGTASASASLVEKAGGTVVGFCFLIDLSFLEGKRVLGDHKIHSLITY